MSIDKMYQRRAATLLMLATSLASTTGCRLQAPEIEITALHHATLSYLGQDGTMKSVELTQEPGLNCNLILDKNESNYDGDPIPSQFSYVQLLCHLDDKGRGYGINFTKTFEEFIFDKESATYEGDGLNGVIFDNGDDYLPDLFEDERCVRVRKITPPLPWTLELTRQVRPNHYSLSWQIAVSAVGSSDICYTLDIRADYEVKE